MAYRKPHTMDEFAKICVKGDTKLRQTVGTDLVAYLAEYDNPIECEDIGAFIDALVQWTQGSNYKVAQNALESLTYICDRLQHDFWPYVSPVLPHAIDRLGDQKDCVRERAQLFILKLLEHHVIQPQALCDKLSECFTHKNAKVREEVLLCFINILNEHGPTNIHVNKLTPGVSKLLSDPIPAVRDTAQNTFLEIYKHVGDRLSQDIQKKNLIPSSKLKLLLQRFQELKDSGELLPTAFVAGHDFDEPDHQIPKATKPVKRTISAPTTHRLAAGGGGGGGVGLNTMNNIMMPTNTISSSMASSASSAAQAAAAGAIDEESFLNSMEDVPTLPIISSKDVNEKALKDLGTIIGDKNMQWTKRIDGLKRIRSILMAGGASYDDFQLNLRSLGPPLGVAATDGRSQVVRESCVTIAYMAQVLGNKFEKVASVLLPNLINLIQNSAKVIATAGQLCLRQVLIYTQCPSLIPIVASHARESKSREIRRACCDFIGQIIKQWPPMTALRKQITTISDTIKDGMADADNEARQISRKSFWSFKEVYPEAAEVLLKNLEPTYRRTLLATPGAGDHMSSSSSSSSLNQIPTGIVYHHQHHPSQQQQQQQQQQQHHHYTPATTTTTTTALSSQASSRSSGTTSAAAGSTENLSHHSNSTTLTRAPSLPRSYRQRSGIPVLNRDNSMVRNGYQTPRGAGLRSYTAIDLQAAQRAKARTQYAAMARQKIASGTASLPRPKKNTSNKNVPVPSSKERSGRTRSRPLGGSISQPTSRSVSPSLRNNYLSHGGRFLPPENDTSTPCRPRKFSSSGIPRSTSVSRDHSRETSPTRGSRGHLGYSSLSFRGSSGPGSLRCTPNRDHRPPISPHRPPVMAQKILQQSREAETALAAALQTDPSLEYDFLKSYSGRKLNRSLDNPSDDSEASSVCSERSYESYRRPSDSYSLSGSRTRLTRDHWDTVQKDINEIIKLCASATWTERKEGLIGLCQYFTDGKILTSTQLKKVTEIFPKMFMDQNTKVVSLFLDTLNELLLAHHNELHDWLYMLLQRIFNKLGSELLQSIYKKIEKTLDVIRDNFPIDLQFQSIFRYLTDHTQRPNSKVKITILVYIIRLCDITSSIVYDNNALISQGIDKIITFTDDKKSIEVQNVARNCLIALLNCNTAQFMMLLSQLSRDQQDIASQVVQSLKSKTSTTGGNLLEHHQSPIKSPTGGMLLLNDLPLSDRRIRSGSIDGGFTSREDIHRSLRNTTAEIQNYSFDSSDISSRIERCNTQDLSQMSTGSGLRNNGHSNSTTGTLCSPLDDITDGLRGVTLNNNDTVTASTNGPMSLPTNNTAARDVIVTTTNGSSTLMINASDEERFVKKIVSGEIPEDEKLVEAFNYLTSLIKSGPPSCIIDNVQFRQLLKTLFHHLSQKENEQIQCAVLEVLAEIFRSDKLQHNYLNFVELITLKILKVHDTTNREVIRYAEATAAAMTKFPLSTIVQIINPMITTSENCPSIIEGSLKMLTRMVEANGATELNTDLLNLIVPNVIKAYDHSESPVRKCAVFCLVVMHRAVGEEVMKPHLSKLNCSKLKLLDLYIQRAKSSNNTTTSNNSVPTSPKNSTTTNNRQTEQQQQTTSSSSTTTTTTTSTLLSSSS